MVLNYSKYRFYKVIVSVFLLTQLISTSVLSNSSINLVGETDVHESNLQYNDFISFDSILKDETLYVPNNNIVKLQYIPIDNYSSVGDNFAVEDDFYLSHTFELNLTKSTYTSDSTNQFSISDIAGYSDQLQYGIENITAIPDYFTIESAVSGFDDLADSDYLAIAQGFTVEWDYAEFYGTDIYLDIKGSGSLGIAELDLFLLKDEGAVFPDVTNISKILSNCSDNSFTDANPVPSAAAAALTYYDFDDVILEKGKYFIVANLSTVDSTSPGQNFAWTLKNGGPFLGESYRWDAIGLTWDNRTTIVDYTLAPLLLPLDEFQEPLTFTNPAAIDLKDGLTSITAVDQVISGTGVHNLESNYSVNIKFNNSYHFYKTIIATSSFQVTNSSHGDYSVDWFVTWDIIQVNLSDYSNPSRTHVISTPTDWNTMTYNLYANSFLLIPGIRIPEGYSFNLTSLSSGVLYQAASLNLSTSSPNYIFDLDLNSLNFDLGYWETDGINATGYSGSSVTADIYVKDSLMTDVLDGNVNFTLYDPDGYIVPVKNDSLFPTLIYNDVSNYTFLETSQTGVGLYSVETSFDPSFEGTDKEGYWTAVCFWQNGTEIGFYSLQISVSKSTTASFRWEETVGGSMTSNSSIVIERINLKTITAQIIYNNISDPFYSGNGTPIIAAPVAYNTSWGTSGLLNYVGPYYELDIPINVLSGNYSVTLMATGLLLESHSITFYLIVHHTFDITPESSSFSAYYNDLQSLIRFTVEDTANLTYNPILPDEMYFYLDDVLLVKDVDYGIRELPDSEIQLEIYSDIVGLDLGVGSHPLDISVAKQGFFEDYGQEIISDEVSLTILETPTEIVILSSEDEVNFGNETTISFIYVDTIHSQNISGATFDVSFDIEDAELITQYEIDGVYYVTLRIHEPQETTINVFVTIFKDGFENQTNLAIESISIINPQITGKIPPILYVVISLFSAAAIIIPIVFLVRRRLTKNKRLEKALFSRIYSLYESVLSITKIIIVHKNTGLPVYEMDLGSEITLDPSLITGFLSAISSMGVELRGDRAGSVRRLQYRNFLVTGTESGQFTTYTFSDTELNEEIEERLAVISDWFAKMFSQITEDWDGSTEVFRINLQGITEKIMKEIHLWIFYPFTVSPHKTSIIEEFNGLEKQLITYIIENENVTISKIFDELDHIRIEKGLPIIFGFIEKGILTPVFDAYKIATVRF